MTFGSSFWKKRVSVSTYFDVFSNLILQWLQKYVIAKAGETRGSRTALLDYIVLLWCHSEVKASTKKRCHIYCWSKLNFVESLTIFLELCCACNLCCLLSFLFCLNETKNHGIKFQNRFHFLIGYAYALLIYSLLCNGLVHLKSTHPVWKKDIDADMLNPAGKTCQFSAKFQLKYCWRFEYQVPFLLDSTKCVSSLSHSSWYSIQRLLPPLFSQILSGSGT